MFKPKFALTTLLVLVLMTSIRSFGQAGGEVTATVVSAATVKALTRSDEVVTTTLYTIKFRREGSSTVEHAEILCLTHNTERGVDSRCDPFVLGKTYKLSSSYNLSDMSYHPTQARTPSYEFQTWSWCIDCSRGYMPNSSYPVRGIKRANGRIESRP